MTTRSRSFGCRLALSLFLTCFYLSYLYQSFSLINLFLTLYLSFSLSITYFYLSYFVSIFLTYKSLSYFISHFLSLFLTYFYLSYLCQSFSLINLFLTLYLSSLSDTPNLYLSFWLYLFLTYSFISLYLALPHFTLSFYFIVFYHLPTFIVLYLRIPLILFLP